MSSGTVEDDVITEVNESSSNGFSSDIAFLPTAPSLEPIVTDFTVSEGERDAFSQKFEGWLDSTEEIWTSKIAWVPQNSEEFLALSDFCNQHRLVDSWANKDRLDMLFDCPLHLGTLYYSHRFKYFQNVANGATPNFNKTTGSQLEALLQHANLLPDPATPYCILDINGAPGQASEYFLNLNSDNRVWEMTHISTVNSRTPIAWNQSVVANPSFTRLTGATGDGNLQKFENIEYLRTLIERQRLKIDFVITDAYIAIPRIKTRNGEIIHQENLQELFALRSILSFILTALQTLTEGGHFICKIFDTFSLQTASLIFFVSLVFDHCVVVKLGQSQYIHAEKFLIGKSFRKDQPLTKRIIELLTHYHRYWLQDQIVSMFIPAEFLDSSSNLKINLTHLNESLIQSQMASLKTIIDNIVRHIPRHVAAQYHTFMEGALRDCIAKIKSLEANAKAPKDFSQFRRLKSLFTFLCQDSQLIGTNEKFYFDVAGTCPPPPKPAPPPQNQSQLPPDKRRRRF